MGMTFYRKDYGRVFVEKSEDVEKVKEVMREVNSYEFEGYYPSGNREGELVTVFNEENLKAIYTHKFDSMDMTKVMVECWRRGIKCFMVQGKITGFEDF